MRDGFGDLLPLAHCYGRLTLFFLTDVAGRISFSTPARGYLTLNPVKYADPIMSFAIRNTVA